MFPMGVDHMHESCLCRAIAPHLFVCFVLFLFFLVFSGLLVYKFLYRGSIGCEWLGWVSVCIG